MTKTDWVLLASKLLLVAVASAAYGAEPCVSVEPIAGAQRSILDVSSGMAAVAPVALPDELPFKLRSERLVLTYTLEVSPCANARAAGLWLSRVGAPYRISSNAAPLMLLSATPTSAGRGWLPVQKDMYNGRIPALFALPPGTRSVTVELQTLPYVPSGIVHARLGPTHLLLPIQANAVEDVVGSADAASGILLVLGLIALLLWLHRRADRSLLWLAVASGLWGVRGLAYFGHAVHLPPLAFEQFNSLNVLMASGALSASVVHLLGGWTRGECRGLVAAMAGSLGAMLVAAIAGQGAGLARAFCLLTSFGMGCWLLRRVWHKRNSLPRPQVLLLMFSLGTMLVFGIHDFMVIGSGLSPDEPSYVFWGFVVLLIGFATMSGQYVVLTLNRAERINEELELHVERKSRELESSYKLLRDSEHEATRVQERDRLVRDMHDGLGALLMTALRGVERGALEPPQVARALQDGLDELRLLMDSAEPEHFLPGTLATWRNRWDGRLTASGVALEWRMDESLDRVELASGTILHIMRILQEAASNVVKHSRARHMSFDARVSDVNGVPMLCIEILDDGLGPQPDPVRPGARGMKNMRHRANQIGARLLIGPRNSSLPGWRVVLELPLPEKQGLVKPPALASPLQA